MAAGAEIAGEAAKIDVHSSSPNTYSTNNSGGNANFVSKESDSKSEIQMQEIVDMLSKLKLNPMAKEFIPSSYSYGPVPDQFALNFYVPADEISGNDGYPNRRRRNSLNQGRRRLNGRAFRAQREDSIRRTVYVSDIDHHVTEEQLAALFSACRQVVDCRVCGDPHSRLRFAFVEFGDEYSARADLNLGGTQLGFSHVRVLPSKTAILPVNPTFLPKSEDELEMCARTVYCTNIDKKVSQADVKMFFETRCGEVSRLRLLGDHVHSAHIAFVEFVLAQSAIVALDCCGQVLGSQPIRVSPSKTPVRARVPRPVIESSCHLYASGLKFRGTRMQCMGHSRHHRRASEDTSPMEQSISEYSSGSASMPPSAETATSSSSPSGDLACAIAALVERQQVSGDSSSNHNGYTLRHIVLPMYGNFSNISEQVPNSYPNPSAIQMTPNTSYQWVAEVGASYAGSDADEVTVTFPQHEEIGSSNSQAVAGGATVPELRGADDAGRDIITS